jgi:hypothetical protein
MQYTCHKLNYNSIKRDANVGCGSTLAKKNGLLQCYLQPLMKTVAHKTCSTFPKGRTNK